MIWDFSYSLSHKPSAIWNQWQPKKIDGEIFHPLHAKFFIGNKNIYLHFVSFLHIDMSQVVETLPQIRQEPTYST